VNMETQDKWSVLVGLESNKGCRQWGGGGVREEAAESLGKWVS
jgi:hypothetical protein